MSIDKNNRRGSFLEVDELDESEMQPEWDEKELNFELVA